MKRQYLDSPLHSGKCPPWLFVKMRKLARLISEAVIVEYGPDEFLKKLTSAFWFQAFGSVLAFDWHSSGLTTTVCGALKEAFKDLSEYGMYVCGGKGGVSRKTPSEIESIGDKKGFSPENLIYASKMSAKVDSSCLQDGFELYHHTFIFTDSGNWGVIQQGMSKQGRWARRYHWLSEGLKSFVSEPHKEISSNKKLFTFNMVDKEVDSAREGSVKVACSLPDENLSFVNKMRGYKLPRRHQVLMQDINSKYLNKILLKTYEKKPENFQSLIETRGVGAKTVRALALISELVHGSSLSFKDPARFSFAHGGKDGYPYRVHTGHYQKTIDILDRAVKKSRIERNDKVKALRRLHSFYQ